MHTSGRSIGATRIERGGREISISSVERDCVDRVYINGRINCKAKDSIRERERERERDVRNLCASITVDLLRNERVLFLFFFFSSSSLFSFGIAEVIGLLLVSFSLVSFISLLACVDGC